MLNLEILDQVEKLLRWKDGPKVIRRARGYDASLNFAAPRPADNFGIGGGAKGGMWEDADTLILGMMPAAATYHTYKYVLSTDTMTRPSASLGPAFPSYIAREQASGIIWMVGVTGATWYLYKWNPSSEAWTQVLSMGGQPFGMQFSATGILYFLDNTTNYYTLINGTASVTTNPGLTWLTYLWGYCSTPNMNRTLYDPGYGTFYATRDNYPLGVRQGGAWKSNVWLPERQPHALGKASTGYSTYLTLGTTTNSLTWAVPAADVFAHRTPFMTALYNDHVNVVIGWSVLDYVWLCYRLDLCVYNTATDTYRPLPSVHLPSKMTSAFNTNYTVPIPQAARDNGEYLSIYLFVPNEIAASNPSSQYAMQFIEAQIPL